MGFLSRTNLVRDEIDDEFSISSKGVGIGIGTRIDIGIERDLFPEIFESGRSITRTRFRNQRFNWSAEAPVPPFNRKHYQSRSHSSQEKLVLWVSFSSSQSTQTGPQKSKNWIFLSGLSFFHKTNVYSKSMTKNLRSQLIFTRRQSSRRTEAEYL